MTCQMTPVPPPGEIDIPKLHAKYLAERNRRMRPDGQEQYAPPTDHFTHDTIEHDPFMPVVPRDAIVNEIEVAILGAGWTGVLAAYHLTRAGITDFRLIDHAADFGRPWYRNRYPRPQSHNAAHSHLPLPAQTRLLPPHPSP